MELLRKGLFKGRFVPIKYTAAIVFIVAACVATMGALFFTSMTSTAQYRVSNLEVVQYGTALHLSWDTEDISDRDKDDGAAGYMVFLQENGERPQLFQTAENECDISLDVLDREYRVTVTAMNRAGGLSAAVSDNIMTHKLSQTIETEKEKFIGLKNKARDMEEEANSEMTFSSSDESIVEISKDGIMSYKNDGKARITITAEENDQYRSTRKTVPVTVYPDVLDTPIMKKESKTATEVTLSWEPVEYAKGYTLRKYDPARDKYRDIMEMEGTETSVTLPRDEAKYKVKATAMVAGDQIESDPSEEIDVAAAAAKAQSFGASHNLGTLNSSNLEVVARIDGVGSASVPQSMSHVGDSYVVTFVNFAGSVGALVSYSNTGEYQGSTGISGMGHANGSTYNPNTGHIYTVKTHREIRSASCTAFDAATGETARNFTLPRTTSGIAYDETNNKYYLSKGNELYICDSDFNVEKFIWKRIRYNHAQDIGGHNGVVMVCTWVSGNTSYIDLYRVKDGAYLGSYNVPIGEIESCFMDNKHLIILMNNGTGGLGDCILRTRDPVELP